MIARSLREQVRTAYSFQCGYCGVSEVESGGELEIDHFRPLAHGGSDELPNLVYACVTCNRFKGGYWPAAEASDELMLLHPGRDDLTAHLTEALEGKLVGLTPRGWFHIRRLHLNRAPLAVLRQQRGTERRLQHMLDESQRAQADLRADSQRLEREVTALLEVIARLTADRQ